MGIGQKIVEQIVMGASLLFLLGGGLPAATGEPLLAGNGAFNGSSSLRAEGRPSNETLGSGAPASSPTAGSFRSTLERILVFTGIPGDEDYDDSEEETDAPVQASTFAPPKPCDYDRCRHLQASCEELQRKQRCLCPGISGPAEHPDPPRIQDVSVSEEAASVHWCAPLSTVSEYLVLYWRQGERQNTRTSPALNGTFRLVTLSDLQPATSYVVCVVASNKAGSSPVSEEEERYGPCKVIWTQGRQPPYLYVALAVTAALVLLVLAALGWYYWARKKSILHGSASNIADPAGVPNPFYKSESVEQL
ncbi:LRRN4 C-terminal-like protein [Rhinatrema bivittatum]|uniref:LRRN4 C-terminal-like protein n=1 Tax=Rhinatrema bivittatum TaxID=194408 RepID=UPI00112AE012|nr:LRRN4 C-terminal-like protein [Rhinatrema bivittatum]